ncbi:ABC-F family ATP-binding cassette domain-containing protein [Phragmitibacter flavus]|uniref:ABC-F family ATP-binding cassette domain-containing protein n=1 Tax=Phragmitibacter flavus TaxID=2576071 RepID=A0A5R8KA79_9BACT|nr:ABC-F family ATP-binding cassette domain-containing protein [Phragmitibacter flavus]TLD69204.1 ABC-F family ATP-binding cassette domain-containing protein [Phragmitibacter flavus]
MLAAENLGISYGPRRLFGEVNFTIRAGERVSLAGPNGAGKSTLLKMIAGVEQGDEGKIIKAKTVQVGYLPQEGVEIKGRTILAEAETAFQDAMNLQKEMDEVGAAMDEMDPQSDEYGDALELYGDLQLRLEHHDVSRMRSRIEKVMTGLGFKHSDLDRLTDEFSGGWQMRIALGKLLLAEPSVLLLDEPTNHLDIETVVWLEEYLKGYPGAIILISHDKRLLDNLTNRTLAFENGRASMYQGNYSFFLRESAARREQLVRAKANQDREIAKTQQFIDKFRAKASKASQAQSRIKMLEKVERIELESDEAEIGFRFPQPPQSGHSVMRLEGVAKSYDGVRMILQPFDFEIFKGDRIAIVGVNGAGKTTFSKIVAGVEKHTGGDLELGHKVAIGYYSQDHADALDGSLTVFQTIEKAAKRMSESEMRTLLGCFLFKGDDVWKSVKVLSGGERGRLALAGMLLRPSNFLVLDEPTNHLDMRSQGVLQKALEEFGGSYVIVSHNRDFLDPIVNKTLEFRVGEAPRLYLGNLSYYLEKRAEEQARAASQARVAAAVPVAKVAPAAVTNAKAAADETVVSGKDKERRRLDALRRQEKTQVLKPLQAKLKEVEGLIETIEKDKAIQLGLMNAPGYGEDAGAAREIAMKYAELEKSLSRAYSQWSEVSEELERVEAKFAED